MSADWITIALLILGGISIIIVEIIFVPGTTVVGVLGFSMSGYGIYRSYELFGTQIGNIVLVVSTILGIAATFYSFKSNLWKKFSLERKFKAKVNEDLVSHLEVGDEGKAISTLKPTGTAEFGDEIYEVSTIGQFIDEKILVRIIKIEQNKIIVEPIIKTEN